MSTLVPGYVAGSLSPFLAVSSSLTTSTTSTTSTASTASTASTNTSTTVLISSTTSISSSVPHPCSKDILALSSTHLPLIISPVRVITITKMVSYTRMAD